MSRVFIWYWKLSTVKHFIGKTVILSIMKNTGKIPTCISNSYDIKLSKEFHKPLNGSLHSSQIQISWLPSKSHVTIFFWNPIIKVCATSISNTGPYNTNLILDVICLNYSMLYGSLFSSWILDWLQNPMVCHNMSLETVNTTISMSNTLHIKLYPRCNVPALFNKISQSK